MTDIEFQELSDKIVTQFINLFGDLCVNIPKEIILIGMIGALGACVIAAGIERDKAVAALNSVMDDIEAGEEVGKV